MAEISTRAVGIAGAGAILAVALAFATSSDSAEPVNQAPAPQTIGTK